MKWIKLLISILITAALVVALNVRFGQMPAFGTFFNPVSGFWQSMDPQPKPRSEWLNLAGLKDSVLVVYDERMVPHIFANNNHDLIFAQGYVTARDRLWQMELQARASAGRLSEVLGEGMISYDLYQRRIGMLFGAENKLRMAEQHPEILEIVEAYTAGVNSWIDELSPRHVPIEFKLTGIQPEYWSPIKTVTVFMSMAATLTGRTSALEMTNTRARFGDGFMKELFPYYPTWMDPIIPPNTEWDFEPVQRDAPDSLFTPSFVYNGLDFPDEIPGLGSNSWAVSGGMTESGRPILANDPHLQMTLPAIWYEIQLHSPDLNVYGVSIPGMPLVTIGFNEDIAWGFTNSGADVMDLFEIRFRDDTWQEYYHDGEWKPTDFRIETVLVKGGETVVDTVRYTHHGPVPFRVPSPGLGRNIPAGHALQWIAHQPSLEMKAIYKLNKAKDYNDFEEAARWYDSPAQNFTYAGRDGVIALWHNGKFPIRWHGMGAYISDGTDPAYDWTEYIPHEHKPHSVNPERGFVSSANQHPTDDSYPYYLGRFFASHERGARINEVLSEAEKVTPYDMMRLHMDNVNLHARRALPVLLEHIGTGTLEADNPELLDVLRDWNFSMDESLTAPTIFSAFWRNVMRETWYDMYQDEENRPLRYPSNARTLELMIDEPGSAHFQKDGQDGLPDLITTAWNKAISGLFERWEDPADWLWWKSNNANIPHLSRIAQFGRSTIQTGGYSLAVNATRGTHGPSWRMVVSLEDEVQAWAVYPGGQSGDPGSIYYDNFIDVWAEGAYYPLLFFRNKKEALGHLQLGTGINEVKP